MGAAGVDHQPTRCKVNDRHGAAAVMSRARSRSDFFARKAIGWALRQYAYTDPDWVRAFVASSPATDSARRGSEALKRIGDRRGGG
ncbi:MAG: DNA alkylation repair protein [Ilumatobacteraceae bacterium]